MSDSFVATLLRNLIPMGCTPMPHRVEMPKPEEFEKPAIARVQDDRYVVGESVCMPTSGGHYEKALQSAVAKMCSADSPLPFAKKVEEAWASCVTEDGVEGAKLYVRFARNDINCVQDMPMHGAGRMVARK